MASFRHRLGLPLASRAAGFLVALRPIVRETVAVYERGVRLTRAAFLPIAARLTRSATLPKWSVTIRPKEPGD